MDEAIVCFRTAIELDPNNINARANLAWHLATAEDIQLRNPQEAFELARKAVELQPENANNWNNLGVAQYRVGQWQEAVEAFQKADALIGGAGDRVHRFFLAMADWQLGNRDEAREHYAQAAIWLNGRQRPGEQRRFRDEAEQLMGIHAADRAEVVLAYLTQAIEAEPNSANWQLWRDRAAARVQLKQWDKAIQDYDQAIKLNPNAADLFLAQADAYRQMGGYEKAIACCRKVIELDPKHAGAHTKLGSALIAQGNLEEAIAGYSEVIRLDPKVYYYRLRAEVYVELGRWNDAVKDLERAGELGNQLSCFQPVLLFVSSGDMEGYRHACARLYERFGQSDDPKIADWLAWVCKFGPEAIDDLSLALKFAERAVASDPDSARYRGDYAGVLYRAGRYQEAADAFNEAERLRGGEGAVWDWIWLAMIHDRLGNADQARQWLDKACSWIDQSLADQTWTARLELQLLRREAEELISQTPEGKKGTPEGEKPPHEEGQTEEKVKSEL